MIITIITEIKVIIIIIIIIIITYQENFAYCKKIILVLIFNFKGMFIDILKRIKRSNEWQFINCWFLTDSVLKLIFQLDPKSFAFFGRRSYSILPWKSNFDSNEVLLSREAMNCCMNSRPWIVKKAFSEGYAIYKPLGILGFENFDISRVTN